MDDLKEVSGMDDHKEVSGTDDLKEVSGMEDLKEVSEPHETLTATEMLRLTGLRHNRIKNTNSKIKRIQMPCLVQTEALFDEDRGLSLQE